MQKIESRICTSFLFSPPYLCFSPLVSTELTHIAGQESSKVSCNLPPGSSQSAFVKLFQQSGEASPENVFIAYLDWYAFGHALLAALKTVSVLIICVPWLICCLCCIFCS